MIFPKTQGGYILILNTANSKTQVGLCQSGEIIAHKEADAPNDHTRDIIDYIDTVLQLSSVTLDQLDAIAVVVGPGSYTGIRIGIATAQGLALPFKTKLIPLSLLEAMASQKLSELQPSDEVILVCIHHTKNKMICYQIFSKKLEALNGPSVGKLTDVQNLIDTYKTRYSDKTILLIEDNVNLKTLGELAYRHRAQAGEDLTPLYIGQPYAIVTNHAHYH